MPVSGPTVVRRQLGRRLQRLREVAGKTHQDVAAARIASRTKIWRIERGQSPVKVPDVWALCRFYNVDAAETDVLASLAVGTSDQGWWEEFADVIPDWFKLYVGLEAAATRIHTFEELVVPGEFQTADYARAIYQAARPGEDPEMIERHVKLRVERQEALVARVPAPQVVVVLGENVITRQVGGPSVLAGQIQHLRKIDERPNVEVRVLGFRTGAHAAMASAFRIFDFADADDPDVVYVELLLGARYMEKPAEVDAYRRIFQMIYEQSTPIGDLPG